MSGEDLSMMTSEHAEEDEGLTRSDSISSSRSAQEEKKARKALNMKIYDLSRRHARGIEVISTHEAKMIEELFAFSRKMSTCDSLYSNLFVVHNGIGEEVDYLTIRGYLRDIGVPHRLTVFPGLSYGYISCECTADARRVMDLCDRIEAVPELAYK